MVCSIFFPLLMANIFQHKKHHFMKQVILCMAGIICLSFMPKTFDTTKQTGISASPGTRAATDITVSFDYLTNATGYQYGAVFYLHNPNSYTVTVQWRFVGSQNVNFSPTNSDIVTIPAGSKVWISTVTSADHSKAWDSGKVQWRFT
jgi:hypothetical protein